MTVPQVDIPPLIPKNRSVARGTTDRTVVASLTLSIDAHPEEEHSLQSKEATRGLEIALPEILLAPYRFSR